jgi:hypothetical protein
LLTQSIINYSNSRVDAAHLGAGFDRSLAGQNFWLNPPLQFRTSHT